jgi:hypothetical protein
MKPGSARELPVRSRSAHNSLSTIVLCGAPYIHADLAVYSATRYESFSQRDSVEESITDDVPGHGWPPSLRSRWKAIFSEKSFRSNLTPFELF